MSQLCLERSASKKKVSNLCQGQNVLTRQDAVLFD